MLLYLLLLANPLMPLLLTGAICATILTFCNRDSAEGEEGKLDDVVPGGVHLQSGVRICWTSWCESEETLQLMTMYLLQSCGC